MEPILKKLHVFIDFYLLTQLTYLLIYQDLCGHIENIKAIFGVQIGLSSHAEIAQTYYKQLR